MFKRNKVFGVFLTTILILITVLVGCGSNEEPKGANSESNNNEKANNNEKDELYDIVMAYQSFSGVDDLELVQEEINEITKEKINATVTLLPINFGAWEQQTNLMLTSNEDLDLLFAGDDFAQKAVKGQLIPLDDLLETHGQGILDAVPSDILNAGKVEGEIYAVASVKEWASDYGFLMRKDLIDKYDIDLSNVKTMEDLTEVFKVIRENESTMYPVVGGIGGTLPILSYTYPYFDKLGGIVGALDLTKDNYEVINQYEHPAYEEGANLMREWFQADYIMKEAATSDDAPDTLVKADTGFGYFSNLKPGTEVESSRLTGQEMVAARVTDVYQFTEGTHPVMTVARNSKNPEKAVEFLNLLYTDEDIMNLLTLGIESKHYVVNDEGLATLPDGVTETGYPSQQWMYGNNFLTKPWEGNEPDIWDQYLEFNESAIKSPALGFVFNFEPVKNEIAAVTNVIEQYEKGLGTGTLDPEQSLPEFREKLKAAGADIIIEEKQKQLDEWKANN